MGTQRYLTSQSQVIQVEGMTRPRYVLSYFLNVGLGPPSGSQSGQGA